jgi:hypothetical protein
LLPDDSG